MTERRQTELPFAEAEGSRAERRNLLGMALTRAAADCHLSVFVQWVANVTSGGREDGGELLKSYKELADRPWGLCCSVAKAKSTVAKARQKGLVAVREERYVSGGQRANAYTIDWPGVRLLLGFEPRPRSDEVRSESDGGPGVPAALSAQGGALTEHPYKGITFSEPSLSSLFLPDPDPEAEPTKMDLEIALIEELPLLRERATRPVEPLPIRREFRAGIFADLKERHLKAPTAVLHWFRLQLATDRPVTGPHEAGLLLVLATARHATAYPAASIAGRTGTGRRAGPGEYRRGYRNAAARRPQRRDCARLFRLALRRKTGHG